MAEIDNVFPPESLPGGLAMRDARKRMIEDAREELWRYLQKIIEEQKRIVEDKTHEAQESKRRVDDADKRRREQRAAQRDEAMARKHAVDFGKPPEPARTKSENKTHAARQRRLNRVIKKMQQAEKGKVETEKKKKKKKKQEKKGSDTKRNSYVGAESQARRIYGWTDEGGDAARTENPNPGRSAFLLQPVTDFLQNAARRLQSLPILPVRGSATPFMGLRPAGIGFLP